MSFFWSVKTVPKNLLVIEVLMALSLNPEIAIIGSGFHYLWITPDCTKMSK